ncbi:MAG: hypothetical protein UY41_C0027G0023 [Candidatus Moranbacteria bacterium GW2011_GWE1_49_15]|nr:MAG: hypothetical protein UY41_C0027G0023 [Candidatus Moranbacteria bacterium GW2011_GWE1_49_15]
MDLTINSKRDMGKSYAWIMRSFILVLGLAMGFVFLTISAGNVEAAKATNQQELLDLVQRTNVGWDWVPSCGDGAHWSVKHSECVGGTGSDDIDDIDSSTRGSGHYSITDETGLVARVIEVNEGWDWEPRCANGAVWDWNSDRCEKGADDWGK